MKARIKATGEVVEVEKRMTTFADGSKNIYYRDIFNTDRYEEGDIIEMTDDVVLTDVDWQAYRREVAKECAAHLLSTNNPEGGWEIRDIVSMAVEAADCLIARLKEEK